MIVTVLAFLVALAILIVVHEWGHYAAARACGVKVLRFSVGFGRVIFRRMRGDTEFVVSALPLGGYVRMLDEHEGPVPPQEAGQAFNRKPLAQRAFIVAAGPAANLVLAVLLYAATYWIGQQEPKAVVATPVAGSVAERAGLRAGDWVQRWRPAGHEADDDWERVDSLNDLRWALMQGALNGQALQLETTDAAGRGLRRVSLPLDALQASDADAGLLRRIGLVGFYSPARIGAVKGGGPAEAAGLQRGDLVVAVDGRPIEDAQSLREAIRAAAQPAAGRARAGMPVQQWTIERAGQRVVLPVRPRAFTDGETTIGRIDAEVGAAPTMVTVRAGLLDGLQRGVQRTRELATLSIKMLGRMLVGQASVRNLSGPLSIADHAGQSAQMGLVAYLAFLAMISVSLGVLNLLPLPMLDGGHLVYYIFEALTGRPVSDQWLARLQRGGVAVLLLLMSVALYNDVVRLLGLH